MAYALAYFDEVHANKLVATIETSSADEVDNLDAALSRDRGVALSEIKRAALHAEGEQFWAYRARLALLALYLDDLSLAGEMCRISEDPIERTAFIDELATWHGDLARLVEHVHEISDGNVRSALLLAVARSNPKEVTNEVRGSWKSLLENWSKNQPDPATHSAAAFVMRSWGNSRAPNTEHHETC